MKICPECGSKDIIIFDADNDICQKCNKWFPALEKISDHNWEKEKEEIKKLAIAIRNSTKEEFPADLINLEDYIYKTYYKGIKNED